ncbi:hypothetical protein [Rheinheimera sp. UJ63]|uniref:hypothetical protein n=1 Tax=Rheinheimera sp. UJ63 TaxID=2910157 RepID=UPI001F418510|nr:hypothetical protein [Rheinheimera sp. UJ63]MCF4008415.1 hypothetical protein [Rheinheimera sp. UJ63]
MLTTSALNKMACGRLASNNWHGYVFKRKGDLKKIDNILKIGIVLATFVFINGCVAHLNKDTLTSSELVKKHAKMAIAACGQGNVKTVSTEGYECHI